MRATPEIVDLVQSQHGAVSRRQLRALGVPARTLNRLPDPAWTEIHPQVFVSTSSLDSFMRSAWAAHLAAGRPSAISHEAAALLHGLKTFGRAPVVLNSPRGAHLRLDDVITHQIGDMFDRPSQIEVVEGLPVSTLARTFVDLSGVVRIGRLATVLDDALAARRTTIEAVASAIHMVMRPGKPGLRNIVRVVARHQPGEPVPGSELESALLRLLARHGEPMPQRQSPLPGSGMEGLVDVCYLESKLIVEADGRRWHARVAQMKKDHERDAQAARAGFLTLRVLYEHVLGDPEGTVRTIRETRLMRQAQLAA